MGAMKRFAEEVSCVMGKGGELDDEVLAVAQRTMTLASDKNLTKDQLNSENQDFAKLVKQAQETK